MAKAANRDATGPEAPDRMLLHRQILGPRLRLHVRIRAGFAILIAIGALFADRVVGIEGLDVTALLFLALGVTGYNGVAALLTREPGEPARSYARYRRLAAVMYVAIGLDYLALTAAVWLVGGARSPFVAFYLFHVTLSFLYLSRRSALLLAGAAFGLVAALLGVEYAGWLEPAHPLGAVGGYGPLDGRFALTLLAVYGTLFGLVSFLLHGVVGYLRRGESRIRLANDELRRLSELRRDFMNITVHDVKSPIGAAIMHIRNVLEGLGGPVEEKQRAWLERSLARLDGLTDFLGEMRALSDLESGIIEAEFVELSVRPVLEALVEEYRDEAEAKGLELTLDVPRGLPLVLAHNRLLREAVQNYLTNAIRCTPDGGHVTVRAASELPALRIEVEDDGPGIEKERRAELFAPLVRRRPGKDEGASSLGLTIVRRIVDSFGGEVGVESEVGKGSTFHILLPTVGG